MPIDVMKTKRFSLKISLAFCIINSMFRSFIWHARPSTIKLEQLQRPEEGRDLALPNRCLYYFAAQLQHIARAMVPRGEPEDPSTLILLYVRGTNSTVMVLEARTFSKSIKLFPIYSLIQKAWNKLRQELEGYTRFSPI